ncbi:MAG: mechanosensitive ion channel [Holophaga sp.]|nr:mechanosensitive ion channel [Holophaga sp.]
MDARLPFWSGNTAADWAKALLAAAAALGLLYLLKALATRRRRSGEPPGSPRACLAEAMDATRLPLLLALALWVGSRFLELPRPLDEALLHVALLAMLLQAGLWANRVVGCFLRDFLERREAHGEVTAMAAPVLGLMARTALWSLVLLLVLDSFGVNLSTLVAGVGVGGVAVALAVQNILGDIFASLSIALDKPFVLGDFIIVDEVLGTVDRIGLKSTRIQSLSGEQIILANADLLKSRIRNFKRMRERRVLFTFAVTYQTAADALAALPGQLRDIIQAEPRTRFDRAHLREFGDSGLIFEVVYYVLDVDYNVYMDTQQAINFALLASLRAQGVGFAHPVRVMFPRPEAV